MIRLKCEYTEKEKVLIDTLNNFLTSNFEKVSGIVTNEESLIRYDLQLTSDGKSEMILKFGVKETKDSEYQSYVYIPSIVIPEKYRRMDIASEIITILSDIANNQFHFYFYVTGLVNDSWSEKLQEYGGFVDESGDIRIDFNVWVEEHNKKGNNIMNQQEQLILDFLEKSYTGANTMDDESCMTRLARAIAAFKASPEIDSNKIFTEEFIEHICDGTEMEFCE